MKSYINSGDVIGVPAPYAVLSGGGVLLGSLFGVAQASAAIGTEVQILTRGHVSLAKAPSQAWTVGVKIYWDDTAKVCTTVASTNKLIGVATGVVAGGAGDIFGCVLLTSAFTI